MEGILTDMATSGANLPMIPFEELHYTTRGLNIPKNIYHVYRSLDDFVEVEANSAYEAMRESGIEHPYRIRRQSIHRMPMLQSDMLVDVVAEPDSDAAITNEVATDPSEAETAEVHTEESEAPVETAATDAQTAGAEAETIDADVPVDTAEAVIESDEADTPTTE